MTNKSDKPLSDEDRRKRIVKAGIGIGVGSAAVVAALLYVNQSRKKKPETKPDD